VADWAFGPLLLIALLLGLAGVAVLAWSAWRDHLVRWPWELPETLPRLAILVVALLMAAPPVAGHFLASNHNPRFLLAALPGLAVAMAVGALQGRARLVPVLPGLIVGQAVLMVAVVGWAAPSPFAGLRAAQARPALACDWRGLLPLLPEEEPKLLLLGVMDGFNSPQVSYAFHRSGRLVDVTEMPRSEDPVAMAAKVDAVLALESAVDEDVAHYRQYFRQVPESTVARRALAPRDAVARLLSAGFSDAGSLEGPGSGDCRARLLVRR
jgi:hypothetical protein